MRFMAIGDKEPRVVMRRSDGKFGALDDAEVTLASNFPFYFMQ